MKRVFENNLFDDFFIVPEDVKYFVEDSKQFSNGIVVEIYYKNKKIGKASIEDNTGDPLNPLHEDEMLSALSESVKCILERKGIIVKKKKNTEDMER